MLERAATGRDPQVAPGWGQGRATYGGLVGALLLASVTGALRDAGDARPTQPLRALTVSFVAPVAPGPVGLEPTILRRGSNVTQAHALMRQEGAVVAAMLASFGAHRSSTIEVPAEHVMPPLPDPDSIEPFPAIPGATPDFFSHVELRLVTGGAPFSGSESSSITGWMRFRAAPEGFGVEHLVALADAWPPAVLQMLSAPAPASSLSWTLELVDELVDVAPDTHWAYEVHSDVARDGYAHTQARLWRPDGTLTAISRQTVTVFG